MYVWPQSLKPRWLGGCSRLLSGASILLVVLPILSSTSIAQSPQQISLWPTGLPHDAVPLSAEKVAELKPKTHPRGHVLYVDNPSLTVYPADPDKATGCAVVICPGGSYNVLAWHHEGTDVAKFLNSIGVTAFLLKYRVPRRDRPDIHWEPMQDVQRAIRLVRHNADEYKIDPDRIGVLGFSAGGHLTVMAGTQYETKTYDPVDAADQVSCKPDFICPIYAAYLADGYKDNVAELGSLVKITKETPPAFMVVTWDDSMRGAQSALLFVELKKHGVPAELHAFTKGGHGYGMNKSANPVSHWPQRLGDWLENSGWLEDSQN